MTTLKGGARFEVDDIHKIKKSLGGIMKKMILLLSIVLIKTQAFAYVAQYTNYNVDQLKAEAQCSANTCRANDKGAQFQDMCLGNNGMNFSGQDTEIRVVKALGVFGNCYCPCTESFVYQVLTQSKCE